MSDPIFVARLGTLLAMARTESEALDVLQRGFARSILAAAPGTPLGTIGVKWTASRPFVSVLEAELGECYAGLFSVGVKEESWCPNV